MNIAAPSSIFRCDFSTLISWDFRSNFLNANNNCAWPTMPISQVAELRFDFASDEEIDSGRILLLDKISFDLGRVFAGNRTDTMMKQYKAYKGDVIVSKINARKGAIGIVEDDVPVGTTIHFRVLTPDNEKIDTKYLFLALRSSYCRNQFEIQTGGQGKGEISEDRLLLIQVPCPPLDIQERTVRHFVDAENNRIKAIQNLADLSSELDSIFVKKTILFHETVESKVFLANFEALAQWDTKGGRAAAFITANPDFIRLGDYTEECVESVRAKGQPEKEWPIYGVNNKTGVFLSTMQLGKDFNMPYKKIEKDYFFHNPTRANVGSIGIVGEVPEDAVTSPEYQVWKLTGGFLPDFMALLVRTKYFLSLVAFNRVGGVKQRMYYANLAEIRLPMIDLSVQKDFALRRTDILSKIEAANIELAKRKIEIEEMILGTRPVPS